MAHAHAAEPDGRNCQVTVSKSALLHAASPYRVRSEVTRGAEALGCSARHELEVRGPRLGPHDAGDDARVAASVLGAVGGVDLVVEAAWVGVDLDEGHVLVHA